MVPQRIRQSATRPEAAPALFRLLAEAALSRAALDACGVPVALADASAPSRPLTYVNRAFETFFGHRAAEALGRPAAALLFEDAADAERLFHGFGERLRLRALRKESAPAQVDVSVSAVRGSDGGVTHWVLAFCERGGIER
jgi:HTH-type transcriptional regulator, bacterioopsin transcriptional activator and related proteins